MPRRKNLYLWRNGIFISPSLLCLHNSTRQTHQTLSQNIECSKFGCKKKNPHMLVGKPGVHDHARAVCMCAHMRMPIKNWSNNLSVRFFMRSVPRGCLHVQYVQANKRREHMHDVQHCFAWYLLDSKEFPSHRPAHCSCLEAEQRLRF